MKQILLLFTLVLTVLACRKNIELTPDSFKPRIELQPLAFNTLATPLKPTDDAFVRDSTFSTVNYGSDTTLMVKGTKYVNYKRNAYLKFNLTGVTSVTSAKLRVYGANISSKYPTPVPVSIYLANTDNWSENTVTYRTRPGHGNALITTNVSNTRRYWEWDVTSAVISQVSTDGVISFVLKDSTLKDAECRFLSKESGVNKPELIINSAVFEDTAIIRNKPAHQIFVWMENKSFSQIVGSTNAPYMNSLIPQGTIFDSLYPLSNLPSQPQYYAFFGGNQNSVTNNDCRSRTLTTNNLYTNLNHFGKTFAWYSENLPFEGSMACQTADGLYRSKHNPVVGWVEANAPPFINKPLSALNLTDTASFRSLPNVVCVTPNMVSDMHDGPSTAQCIKNGDAWLKANFETLINWAMLPGSNTEVYIYWDEEGSSADPRIPVFVVGEHIKKGFHSKVKYTSGHFSMAKMVATSQNADTTNTYFRTKVFEAKNIREHRIGF